MVLEPFTKYEIRSQRGERFRLCCPHPLTASTSQNVIVTTDGHDHAAANSAHATEYRLAPGFPGRQKKREAMQAKRTARKDGGEKPVLFRLCVCPQ